MVRDSRVLRVEQARGNTLQDSSTTSDDRRDESFLEGTHAYSTKASGDRNSYADAGGGLGSDQHRGSQAGGEDKTRGSLPTLTWKQAWRLLQQQST